jgi:hypothetical protein
MNIRLAKKGEPWAIFSVELPDEMYDEMKEYLMIQSELVEQKVLP